METKRSDWTLSGKLLALSFILLLIDFVLYKLFGESYLGGYSLGRNIFVAMSILCGSSFVGFWIAIIAERVASKRKKHKKNGNST